MAVKRQPWMKFYPSDWQSDEALRQCSLSARGLWVELMAVMHKATPYGTLVIAGRQPTDAQIANLVGSDNKTVKLALAELESWGVFSRNSDGAIFSRRMIRDAEKAERDHLNGKGGGNPNIVNNEAHGVNPPINPNDDGSVNLWDKAHTRAAQKPEARSQTPQSPSMEKSVQGIEGMEPASDTGEPTLNGYRLMVVGERVLVAAKLDPSRWTGTYRPIADWLKAGIEPDAIYAAITKRASAKGYSPPFSLGYFDQIVRNPAAVRAA